MASRGAEKAPRPIVRPVKLPVMAGPVVQKKKRALTWLSERLSQILFPTEK